MSDKSKKLSEMTEEIDSLVLKVKQGDQNAFSELYDIYIDPIYKYVFYRVNKGDAEDLVEMIFLKVWEKVKKYEQQEASFSAWIFRIAHNQVIDYYRSLKKHDYEDLDENYEDDDKRVDPKKNTERSLNSETLKVAIDNLNPGYRDIVIYRFINGFSNREVAQIMGKKEGNLRILQHRALKALKVELEELGLKGI